jgi:CheY-like chemotaxis protein
MTTETGRPIIVVEDNDDDFEALERALKKLRIANPVHRLTTGEAAIEHLRRTARRRIDGEEPSSTELPWTPKPALILLDLNLPGINGQQTIQQIRSDPTLRHIPIVVLSSSKDKTDVISVYDAGGNGYTTKPMEYAELVETMRKLADFWLGTALLP